jgi:serine/threonine protein phosphatase PrpC
MNSRLEYYGISIKGKRTSNQDRYICSEINDYIVLAVADGMGGYNGGEIASQIAIDTIIDVLNRGHASENIKSIISQIYKEIDRKISTMISYDDSLSSMGTTLSMAVIRNNIIAFGNIGDCKIYRKHNNNMIKITKDHSILQDYIDKYGDKSVPEYIINQRHILTKALNGDGDQPDIYPLNDDGWELSDNEFIMISSDGVLLDNTFLTNDPDNRHLIINDYLYDIAEKILKESLVNGSKDNISVVLARTNNKIDNNPTLFLK